MCKHSRLQAFEHRRPLPQKFNHGQQVGVGCWDERFFAIKSNGGKLGLGIDYLTCISGDWIDSHGGKGLTQFACAACMAVTKSSYLPFSNRNKQELYFSSKMNHEFWIKGRNPFGMKRNAHFMKNSADNFWLLPVQEEFSLASVENPGTCITTSDTVWPTGTGRPVTKMAAATCSNATSQRFSVAEFPELIRNEIKIRYETTFLSTSSPFKTCTGTNFDNLAFNIDCGDYVLGEWQWQVSGSTVGLTGECRATSSIGTKTSASWNMAKDGTSGSNYLRCASLARNLELKCLIGQAMTKLTKSGNTMSYQCAHVPGLGGCYPIITEQAQLKDVNSVNFFSSVPVTCAKDEVLQTVAGESSGDKWFRYRHQCCMGSGIPLTILPKQEFAKATFADWEGLYCPSERDASGRPIFTMLTKFAEKTVSLNEAIVIQCEDTKKGFFGGRRGAATKYGDIAALGLSPIWMIQKPSGSESGCVKYSEPFVVQATGLGLQGFMQTGTPAGRGFNIKTGVKNAAQTWKLVSKYGSGTGCVRFNEPLLIQSTHESGANGAGNGYIKNNGGSVTSNKDFAEHFKFFPLDMAPVPGKPTLHTVSERLMVRWTLPPCQFPIAETYVGVQEVGDTNWKYIDTSKGNRLDQTRAQVGAGVHPPATSALVEGIAKNKNYQAAVTVRVGAVWGKWSRTSDAYLFANKDDGLTFVKTPVHYWVDDGCHSRDGLNDAVDADKYWNALMPLAGARCCNSNGGGCATPVECPQTLTWDQANKICTGRSQRLCRRDELSSCCNTGGGHRRRRCDAYPVWTSTKDTDWKNEV
jgi:hypothetical protein